MNQNINLQRANGFSNNPQTGEFVPPQPGYVGPSISGLDRWSESYDTGIEAPPNNQPQIVDMAKATGDRAYTGLYWFRIPLNYSGYGYRQVGKYVRDNGKRASGALYSDGRGYLCLPPITYQQSVTPPAATFNRVYGDSFIGVHVFTGRDPGTANLFRETSSTDPTEIAVAGYTPPAGCINVNAMRSIMINGAPYLAICFQSGGANTIQILSDLANPPTSAVIPVGGNPTYDVIQTSIDGNALLIYGGDGLGNGIIRAIRTDVGAAVTVPSAPRCYLTPGGYAVGLSTAEDDDAMAYWVEPMDDALILVTSTTKRGRLLKTDIRGYLPVTVDVPLRWVTFATKCRGGIVVCDQYTHWYLNKRNPRGKWRRMAVFDDFPANSDKQLVCRGHSEKDGRFIIEVNETITPSGTGNTMRYGIEWDFDSWNPCQVEAKQPLAATGELSCLSPKHPWSAFTLHQHIRTANPAQWHRIRQGPLGENLFNQRKTVGAQAGTGVEYAASEDVTLPAMDIDGLETMVKTITRVYGPKPSAVAAGGTGAYVGVEELLSGRTGLNTANGQGCTFYGTEPTERIPYREYKTISWTYQFQFKITEARQTGGTDPTRFTPNAFNNDIWIEGVASREPVKALPASIYRQMDRQRGRPTP